MSAAPSWLGSCGYLKQSWEVAVVYYIVGIQESGVRLETSAGASATAGSQYGGCP